MIETLLTVAVTLCAFLSDAAAISHQTAVSPPTWTILQSKQPSLVQLNNSLSLARELLHSLKFKYGENHSDIYDFMIISEPARRFLHARFITKVARKAEIAFRFTGTSVTAGHDNYFSSSYPVVFDKLLKPVVEAAGVTLSVHNLAMGFNPITPFDLCLETIAGKNVDVISWEQGMMCPGNQADCIEIFLRNSLQIPSHPGLLILDAVPDADKTASLSRSIRKMFHQRESGVDIREYYKNWTIHYFIAATVVQGRQDDPYFNHERLMVDAKPFDVKKSWHPGPHGHELVADILAHNYVRIYAEALEVLLDLLRSSISDEEMTKYLEEFAVIGNYDPSNLPGPAWRDQDHYLEHPGTSCASLFEPKIEQDSDLKYFISDPSSIADLRPQLASYDESDWGISLWINDVVPVQHVVDEHKGYLDRKFVLAGSKDSGTITFKITTRVESSQVTICTAPRSWHGYPAGYTELSEQSVSILFDSDPTPATFSKLSTGPCYTVHYPLSVGEHLIHLSPLQQDKIALSHLIWN